MERILVAMSGGVDSAVAALLLKRAGAEIEGAYMKNWINEDNVLGECPWQQDIVDARAAAEKLGIPFRVVNLMREYRERVVEYLLDGYRRGITPNPDTMCNREIKFGVFLDYARREGFSAVATGHYAIRREVTPGRWGVFEGADPNKDQSYFLALLRPEQVAAARFPVGHLLKPELRVLAREAGLPVADKKDSQGICFIGNVRMQDFLRHYVPDNPGPIVRATDGTVLGAHRGLHLFTIGQRRGIGIPSNTDHENYVVVGRDTVHNRLLVAFESEAAPGLWARECLVAGLSFLDEPLNGAQRLLVRARYRDPAAPARFEPSAQIPGQASVVFEKPQRALAPGQVIALYAGDGSGRLLGGGFYEHISPLVPTPAAATR
ncbi:MAG: tRNA 2-thiouridine(34) synthase MnmA [Opitutaceae bacterium]|nr:tRNA 2-thiouridine(34) synthase MnmA [Opitutaceae bacterium]